jgi:hypothetical protein
MASFSPSAAHRTNEVEQRDRSLKDNSGTPTAVMVQIGARPALLRIVCSPAYKLDQPGHSRPYRWRLSWRTGCPRRARSGKREAPPYSRIAEQGVA